MNEISEQVNLDGRIALLHSFRKCHWMLISMRSLSLLFLGEMVDIQRPQHFNI